MSASTIIVIIVVLVILAVAAAVVSMLMRRRTTERAVQGPEYDRLADEVGPRKAQAEFARRRQRVDGLGITSLSDERRTAYTGQWDAAQEQFVDNPAQAVRSAGAMITAVTADRGYDVTDHDQLLTDLSVHHGRYLDGYRHAYETTGRAGQASTEDLRRALLGYRVLFFDLLELPGSAGRDGEAGPEPDQADAASAEVPAQRPWQQATQGRHWKTRRQEESESLPANRR